MSEWQVRKTARVLESGDRIIFSDDLGGEGEVLTVESATNLMGTMAVETEELDFTLDLDQSTMVTMAATPIEVSEVTDTAVTITIDGLTIAVWRSALEFDEGQPVIQIDGAGTLRVNVNDYPVWNADPDHHEHSQCECVTDFEAREVP